MSFQVDDADPASLLKDTSLKDEPDYRAPLNGDVPEPSIDGTSVNGGEGGVRAATEADVGEEEKKVSKPSSRDSIRSRVTTSSRESVEKRSRSGILSKVLIHLAKGGFANGNLVSRVATRVDPSPLPNSIH